MERPVSLPLCSEEEIRETEKGMTMGLGTRRKVSQLPIGITPLGAVGRFHGERVARVSKS